MKNKLDKIPLFIKIWICHIFIFFPIRGIFFLIQYKEQSINFTKILQSIIISPFAGFYGIFDKFPLAIILQMIIMYLLTREKYNHYILLIYWLIIIASNILFYCSHVYDITYLKDFGISFGIYSIIFFFLFKMNKTEHKPL